MMEGLGLEFMGTRKKNISCRIVQVYSRRSTTLDITSSIRTHYKMMIHYVKAIIVKLVHVHAIKSKWPLLSNLYRELGKRVRIKIEKSAG